MTCGVYAIEETMAVKWQHGVVNTGANVDTDVVGDKWWVAGGGEEDCAKKRTNEALSEVGGRITWMSANLERSSATSQPASPIVRRVRRNMPQQPQRWLNSRSFPS